MNIYQTLKLSVLASCVAIAPQLAMAADYSRAEKELRIMSKIFETSINDSRRGDERSYFPGSSRNTESTYLAKQGMVFTFSFNQNRFGDASDWQALGEGIGEFVGTLTSEIAHSLADNLPNVPEAPVAPTRSYSEHDWEDQVEIYEEFQQAMENLRDEQRDKREEVRDLQRSIRDLERKARREEVDSKKLSQTKAKLEEKVNVLNKKMEQYEKAMKEYRDKKAQQLVAANKKKSDLIVSTLCDYGTTLRSLENDEHVTLVFSNFAKNKDQIYVFNYKDVKSCSSKDKLLKKAVSYQI
ncbi:MAG: hypothetical protein ACPGJI_06375 [Kangiellaceae bacterium]